MYSMCEERIIFIYIILSILVILYIIIINFKTYPNLNIDIV